MAVVKLLVAAAAAYLILRAGVVFGGAVGAVVAALVLGAGAFAAWSRRELPVVAGLVVGAALSAVALTL